MRKVTFTGVLGKASFAHWISVSAVAGLALLASTVWAQTSPVSLSADGEVLQRLKNAHGGARLDQMDMVASGRVTLQTANGPVVIPVTVLRNRQEGQRILFNQSDGKGWDGNIEHLEPLSRRILEFVETQFARGLPTVLKAASREAAVLDRGTKDGVQLLHVRERNGAATQYSLEASTSRLRRMEFQRGQSRDASGKAIPNIETYVFSDFRSVSGLATPFKVEHYRGGTKQEELEFISVTYVAATRDPNLITRGGQR